MRRLFLPAFFLFAPLSFALQTAAPKPVRVNPVALSQPQPKYTDAAKAAHIQGDVGLELTVDQDGKASQIRVTNPLGYGLDENAVEAVKQWRFRPATVDGKPTSLRAQLTVSFRLHQPPQKSDLPLPIKILSVLIGIGVNVFWMRGAYRLARNFIQSKRPQTEP